MSWVVRKRWVNRGTSGDAYRIHWLYVSRGHFQAGWRVGGDGVPGRTNWKRELKLFPSKEAAECWLIEATLKGRIGMSNSPAETIFIEELKREK